MLVSPGWYAVSADSLTSLSEFAPIVAEGAAFVRITPDLRASFFSVISRCDLRARRLTEAEARRLEARLATHLATSPTALNSRFTTDRSLIARWLASHAPSPATPDRGAAYRATSVHTISSHEDPGDVTDAVDEAPSLSTHGLVHPTLGWVTDEDGLVVYLRLYGRGRSDLTGRYCAPIRSFDDLDLADFRRALLAAPTEPASWRPAPYPL